MVDVWDSDNWSPRFIRQLHDWESEEVEVFYVRLYEHSISLGTEDIIVWLFTKKGNFSIKSFYSSLTNRIVESFPYGIVWNS